MGSGDLYPDGRGLIILAAAGSMRGGGPVLGIFAAQASSFGGGGGGSNPARQSAHVRIYRKGKIKKKTYQQADRYGPPWT